MKLNVDTVVGGMAIIVVLYRIIFMMIPMLQSGIATKNIPLAFKSFTLVV